MKQQKQRKDQFSQGPMADSLPSAALAGHMAGSALQRANSRGHVQDDRGSVAIEMGGFDNPQNTSQTQMFAAQVRKD